MTAEERFWAKVEKHDDDCPCCGGCWHWTGAIDKGYGRFYAEGRVGRDPRMSTAPTGSPFPWAPVGEEGGHRNP